MAVLQRIRCAWMPTSLRRSRPSSSSRLRGPEGQQLETAFKAQTLQEVLAFFTQWDHYLSCFGRAEGGPSRDFLNSLTKNTQEFSRLAPHPEFTLLKRDLWNTNPIECLFSIAKSHLTLPTHPVCFALAKAFRRAQKETRPHHTFSLLYPPHPPLQPP